MPLLMAPASRVAIAGSVRSPAVEGSERAAIRHLADVIAAWKMASVGDREACPRAPPKATLTMIKLKRRIDMIEQQGNESEPHGVLACVARRATSIAPSRVTCEMKPAISGNRSRQ